MSYREPSSDEDLSNSDSGNASTRRRPTRRSARHSTEVEPESPVRPDSPPRTRPVTNKRTLRRQGKRRISYRDESTDEDSEDYGEAEYLPEEAVVPPKAHPQGTSPFTRRKPSGRDPNKFARSRVRTLGGPLKEKEGMSLDPRSNQHC